MKNNQIRPVCFENLPRIETRIFSSTSGDLEVRYHPPVILVALEVDLVTLRDALVSLREEAFKGALKWC